jgi:hypothetical protein
VLIKRLIFPILSNEVEVVTFLDYFLDVVVIDSLSMVLLWDHTSPVKMSMRFRWIFIVGSLIVLVLVVTFLVHVHVLVFVFVH